ncbi:MAG: type II toxin-antitoxin system ParD family antitoxin [Myxococcaceae bacterium]
MSSITVSLTPELRELVEAKVRSGMYGNISEVVREALRDWDSHAATEDAELEQLVAAGLRGKALAWNDALMARVRKAPTKKRKK